MITAFAILIIAVIISQYLMINAIKQLSDEDKVKLMSGRQLNWTQLRPLIYIAVYGIFYFALISFSNYAYYFLNGFIIFFVVERIYSFISARKRLCAMDLPTFYIKRFNIATIINSAGLTLFFVFLLKGFYFY